MLIYHHRDACHKVVRLRCCLVYSLRNATALPTEPADDLPPVYWNRIEALRKGRKPDRLLPAQHYKQLRWKRAHHKRRPDGR